MGEMLEGCLWCLAEQCQNSALGLCFFQKCIATSSQPMSKPRLVDVPHLIVRLRCSGPSCKKSLQVGGNFYEILRVSNPRGNVGWVCHHGSRRLNACCPPSCVLVTSAAHKVRSQSCNSRHVAFLSSPPVCLSHQLLAKCIHSLATHVMQHSSTLGRCCLPQHGWRWLGL